MLLACVLAAPVAAALPELPRVLLDTTYAPPTGNTITVNAGGNLQTAINNAQPGDTIVLQAGATFTGTFTLPNKGTSTQWIYIRSSAYASLPPPGNRVSPANVSSMATLVGTGSPVIAVQTAAGAHHYRFIGIEFKPGPGLFSTGLIRLGNASETSASQFSHNIVIDRCYIHGDPAIGGRRGVALNNASSAVIDSYLSDWKEDGADSQAIMGWNGPGPFKIANNYLEGAGENVMFGGADPTIANVVPSDIEIRGNRFAKPIAWRSLAWDIKNLFELKNSRRTLVEGNVFEYTWFAAQDFAINIKSVNQTGSAPWAVTEDLTFRHNIVRHAPNAIKLCGLNCDGYATAQGGRYLIQHNLFDDVNAAAWGGSGNFLQTGNTTPDLTVSHNTVIHNGSTYNSGGGSSTGFVFTDNIVQRGPYGFKATGTSEGLGTLGSYFPGYTFAKNIVAGAPATSYPTGNYFPPAYDSVGFVNPAGGDYRLAATSPYRNAGSDARDLGADIVAVNAATACAVNGQCGTESLPDPAPADAPPVISAVGTSSVTASQAVIGWTTGEPADSLVEYGPTSAYGSVTTLDTAMLVSHARTLGNLAASTAYHYRVKSRDAAGNLSTSGDFTFTTAAAAPVADTTPPAISGVANAAVTSSGATIAWTTNEAADTQLEFGHTTAYGSATALDPALVTSHSQSLSGLAASTVYHYRVKSRDAAGNVATSGDYLLTTLGSADTVAPSIPAGLALSGVRSNRMTLNWKASSDNVAVAGYRLDMSTNSAFASFVSAYQNRDVGNVTTFRASGLARGTTYYFRLRAYDAAGNVSAYSATASARTY